MADLNKLAEEIVGLTLLQATLHQLFEDDYSVADNDAVFALDE